MGDMQAISNARQRWLPAYYGAAIQSAKHDHYRDFGWPETLTFTDFHRTYCRNGLATAAIDKTIAKTWETMPALWETEEATDTPLEQDVRRHLTAIRAWQMLSTADRRGMVGAYAGAILLLRDSKKLEEPVDRVSGGIESLAGIIPAWEGQLTIAEWNTDPASEAYGQPLAYQFDESAVDGSNKQARQVRIHPDRVLIWSEDGTVNGRSTLEPGFNSLRDAEKVSGAGGEGFWKSSRGSPMFEAPQGMSMSDMLKAFQVGTPGEVIDKINDQVDDWQSGFDKALIIAGMTAKPLQITLPVPEHFFNIPVMTFAASMQIPVRILIGNQTGERASTEDARDWAQVCMGRRQNIVIPVLDELVRRLVKWSMLPKKDWTIGWDSLLDATPDQMLDRAAKMAEVNAKTLPGDTPAFLPKEIRETAGYDPDEGPTEEQGEDTTTEKDDPPAGDPQEDDEK